jgi:predicted PurR-regulated permease PerM
VYLLAVGSVWQGLALVVWGVVVIGLSDSLLRPLLVGKNTRMPDYLVLLSTLGGMSLLGINGFVIGPTIAALFIAAWALFNDSGRLASEAAQAAAPPPPETAPPTPEK